MRVYWRNNSGKLSMMETAGVSDHQEAILVVKEFLVETGEGYTEPVLAVIGS